MDAHFWHERWARNEIGFHEARPNPLLTKYCERLPLTASKRVFVPLCGKTLDIGWLMKEGFNVCGIEINADAVKQLFEELDIQPDVSECGPLRKFSAQSVEIFVGDLFDLSRTALGPVDAVYDRAALVALPEEARQRYTGHLMQITDSAPQLLITFQYDQALMEGPPFSIPDSEIAAHYGESYKIEKLAAIDVAGGLKGTCAATEVVWLLDRR